MTETIHSKIGANKGQPHSRVWIEGKRLADAGFAVGVHYDREITPGAITLRVNASGKFKVSGKGEKPVIDITGKIIAQQFPPPAEKVAVAFARRVITITAV